MTGARFGSVVGKGREFAEWLGQGLGELSGRVESLLSGWGKVWESCREG